MTLHGTDLRHPRSRRITRAVLGARPRARRQRGARRARCRRATASPCCPAASTRTASPPLPRRAARERLGLDPEGRYLLFPADPARPAKRHDRARELASAAQLLTLGGVDPAEVPAWVNAANAVLVPSDAEGFGLAVLEALACDVPVLATPVGNHPAALRGVAGTLCAPYDRERWAAALAPHLEAADPRVEGRSRAALWSSDRMAERVLQAWIELAGAPLYSPPTAPIGAFSS